MTDPFEPLRRYEADVRPPSVEAIRRRVERGRRRRQAAVGGGAGVLAVLAILALVIVPGEGDEESRLATGPGSSPEAAASTSTSEPEPEPELEPESTAGGSTAVPMPEGDTEARTSADDASAPAAGEDASQPGASEAAARTLQATVDGPDRPVPPGRKARFTLEVCNTGDDVVEVFFDDAQRYDFHVSRGDKRIWTWSADETFAQVASSERWDPGGCRTWTEAWSGRDDRGRPAPPGRYEVVGLLTSDPALRSEPVEFCMGTCP